MGEVSPLEQLVDGMCAIARRRLFKEIDRRCEHELARRPKETVNRSLGQRYRDRDAEAREAQLRG